MLMLVTCARDHVRPMSSWTGKHRDALIKELGPPRSETALRNGGSRLDYVPIGTWPEDSRYTYQQMEVCRMIFNVDKAGIIESWTFYGCSPKG